MPRQDSLDTHIDVMTDMKIRLFVPDNSVLDQVTPVEVILGESLLTPGLQTSVRVQSYIHHVPKKNLDDYKDVVMGLELERPLLEKYGIQSKLDIGGSQIIYRLDNRKLFNNNTEEFTLHACDQTLLTDAATLVSNLWKCTRPSAVVRQVLSSCAGARAMDIESADPARDYIAENIHPFQVVAQQANVALADGNDPSFLHYMTYQNGGTHHFRSLKSLTKQSPVMEYYYAETGAVSGYADPYGIMTYSFPCDFDLLSDILNGIGPNGANISSTALFNPLLKMFNLFGSQTLGCGVGSAVLSAAMSNAGSAQQQNACPDYSQFYLLKRQARMGLLEQDKIALRLTVPWNPSLNAGKIIRIKLYNKELPPGEEALNYGSGDYLILSMTHNIKQGGYATTTMDCVSETVGQGIQ